MNTVLLVMLGFIALFVNTFCWWFIDRIVLKNPVLKWKQEFPLVFGGMTSAAIGILITAWIRS